ncbi:MAG: CRISPR-associated protein Cas4 [Marinospirillum sp.]|uniref:CRISPR-associated protein Cas4 n=1 Tax=Marinospirillum sp. TaxID=2183934 RepID=UPI0019E754D5|nr:CRISPR-associated protein Cas4 [Marinospirillum sp.]MBE0508903.1 CRISPR-associated protein Cas4 [Marinospirillum sp.]
MDDEKLIPLSALQHYAFCPRQCALIHNEQVWAENFLTAQGQQLHSRVDSGEPETRKGIKFERGVQVAAHSLGLTGKMDLLEKDLSTGQITPVEYKRGKPKPSDWDEIQLCAQALCLEEMTGQTIKEGALWYHQTRHRHPVEFSEALRQRTREVIKDVAQLFVSGKTPPARYEKKCNACSLYDLCNPKIMQKDTSSQYLERLFAEENSDEEASE